MWNNARFVNLIANALTVLALTALSIAALQWLAHRPVFSLAQIVIGPAEGAELEYVTAASVRSSVAGRLSGNFFTADLEHVRETFESVPWVRQAMVRRLWPNGLEVTLLEYQPLGLWNGNQLLDIHGNPFVANQAEAERADGNVLPDLAGPDGSGQLVSQRLAELTQWLRPLGRVPVSLTLSARYAWRAELDNGLVLDMGRDPAVDIAQGGPDGPDKTHVPVQLRVQRFVESVLAVEQRTGRPAMYADLRYPNGYALRLGEAPKPDSKNSTATKP